MIARLTDGMSARALVLMTLLLVVALAAPLFAGDYLLTVLILIFYFAYTGQAWNIMMGFAGQLSLGHAPAPERPSPQEAWDVRAPTVPLRVGWLQPDDISPAAVFLASDAANMVTGAEYEVTGGDSAKSV
jgi:hypothetical protein